MEIMKYLLLTVEVVVGLLLIGIVLLQRSKDQGLGLAFGSGMGEALFGSRAADVLVKGTVVLTILFVLNTLILARMFSASYESDVGIPEGGPAPVQQASQPMQPQGQQPMPITTAGDLITPSGAAPDMGPSPLTPIEGPMPDVDVDIPALPAE